MGKHGADGQTEGMQCIAQPHGGAARTETSAAVR